MDSVTHWSHTRWLKRRRLAPAGRLGKAVRVRKDRGHVSVKTVWDALSAYCYLPWLRDQAVFVEAIQDGITDGDYFSYATSVSADSRYEGLKIDARAAAVYVDGRACC